MAAISDNGSEEAYNVWLSISVTSEKPYQKAINVSGCREAINGLLTLNVACRALYSYREVETEKWKQK